jgi:GntP family gluconate:H+ symporter
MSAESQVSTSPIVALLGFAAVIVLLLFLITRWKWHVFAALLIPLLLFGVLPGIERNNFISAFEIGFGKTLGKIGVVIVLGSVIAEALKHTGAITVITRTMVRLVGGRNMPLALTLTGFVLGIAIFSDVAFVILNPLVHSAAASMRVSIGVMSIGLVGALQLTHAIVPPTPGPLAAAALVGADIGKVILFGGAACLTGSLASWVWGQYIAGPRIDTKPSEEFGHGLVDAGNAEEEADLPGTAMAFIPIIVPVLLITMRSVSQIVLEPDNLIRTVLFYLGWPVVSLAIGAALAYLNIRDRDQILPARTQWVENALRVSAMILVVTGLGGSLSAVLKGTPAVAAVAGFFVDSGLPTILLPFTLGVIGNMITGSTTVGVITAGSLVAPMLPSIGLSPEAAMLSGACGSVIIKYMNSSYFWICTSLTRLTPGEGVVAYGGATLVGGMASFLAVCVMWKAGWL